MLGDYLFHRFLLECWTKSRELFQFFLVFHTLLRERARALVLADAKLLTRCIPLRCSLV